MKKLICFLVLIVLAFSMPVYAAEAPVITLQPQNPVYPEYSCAVYTVKATGSNLSAVWYMNFEGKTYNISDRSVIAPWEAYAGELYGHNQEGNTFTFSFTGIESGLNGAEIYCVVSNSSGSVTSQKALISIGGTGTPPDIEVPASLTVKQGYVAELTCKASGSGLCYTWYETSTGKLVDITAVNRGTENASSFRPETGAVGTRWYVCGVENGEGGICYSSVIPVTVTAAAATVEPQITTKSLPEATVGKSYSCQLSCTDGDATFAVYYNPGGSNQFEQTGLTLTQHGQLEGMPSKAGTYTFTVSAVGDGGEDYQTLTLTVEEAEVKIELVKKPDKLSYKLGEEIDLTGLVVNITKADGTTVEAKDGDMVKITAGEKLEQIGKHEMTISYEDVSVTITVKVAKADEEETEPTEETEPKEESKKKTSKSKKENKESDDDEGQDNMPLVLIIGGSVLLLVITVAVVIVIIKKKKKE